MISNLGFWFLDFEFDGLGLKFWILGFYFFFGFGVWSLLFGVWNIGVCYFEFGILDLGFRFWMFLA